MDHWPHPDPERPHLSWGYPSLPRRAAPQSRQSWPPHLSFIEDLTERLAVSADDEQGGGAIPRDHTRHLAEQNKGAGGGTAWRSSAPPQRRAEAAALPRDDRSRSRQSFHLRTADRERIISQSCGLKAQNDLAPLIEIPKDVTA